MGLVQRVFGGSWFGEAWRNNRRKGAGMSSTALVRGGNALGAYGDAYGEHVARRVNPWLYEAIRESIGPGAVCGERG